MSFFPTQKDEQADSGAFSHPCLGKKVFFQVVELVFAGCVIGPTGGGGACWCQNVCIHNRIEME